MWFYWKLSLPIKIEVDAPLFVKPQWTKIGTKCKWGKKSHFASKVKIKVLAVFSKSPLMYFKTITKIRDTVDYQSTACSFPLRTSPEKFASPQICGAFLA